jgi:hypothetical protein
MGAKAKIVGSTAFTPEETPDTGNQQVYALSAETEFDGETNSVAQIRIAVDDYEAGGSDPVFHIALGHSGGLFTILSGADAAAGIITTGANHLRSEGDLVVFSPGSGGVLPSGMVADVPHYIQVLAANKFAASITPGGSSVHYTDVGTPPNKWRAYGAEGGIKVTYTNLPGGPVGAPVIVKERRGGVPDDFSKVKGWQLLLMPTDPTFPCSGQVWLEMGVDTVPMGYFVIPLEIDGAADTNPRAQATLTIPVGAPYLDSAPVDITVLAAANLTVLLNLMGN